MGFVALFSLPRDNKPIVHTLFCFGHVLCRLNRAVCAFPHLALPAAGDVGLMADLLKDLEDPETLKEVEKLMKVHTTTLSGEAAGWQAAFVRCGI